MSTHSPSSERQKIPQVVLQISIAVATDLQLGEIEQKRLVRHVFDAYQAGQRDATRIPNGTRRHHSSEVSD